MSFATLLEVLDRLVFDKTGDHLNYIQKTILKGTLDGQSYSRIAQKSHLNESYIADKGSDLWRLLSDVLKIDIRKSTARGILKKIDFYDNNLSNKTIKKPSKEQANHLRPQRNVFSQSIYNTDYHKWLEITIDHLRSEQFFAIDSERLIEELLMIGKTDMRIANTLIKHIIIYRLKLNNSPDLEVRKNWQKEINKIQDQLEDLLSLSLKEKINLETIYRRAKRDILMDYAIDLPQECPYSLDDLLTHKEEFS